MATVIKSSEHVLVVEEQMVSGPNATLEVRMGPIPPAVQAAITESLERGRAAAASSQETAAVAE